MKIKSIAAICKKNKNIAIFERYSDEKCECRAEEIEAKNSQKYACGLTEQDVESGWECPLDNPNETVERCEDCAFAKETD